MTECLFQTRQEDLTSDPLPRVMAYQGRIVGVEAESPCLLPLLPDVELQDKEGNA